MTHALPSSPNWYCSNIVACTDDGFFVYGARGDINILRIGESLSHAPKPEHETESVQQLLHSDDNIDKKLDCLLVATLSRVHKERITVILIQSKDVKEYEPKTNNHAAFENDGFVIVSGAEDGKIKCLRVTLAKTEAQTLNSKVLCEYQMPKNCKITAGALCSSGVDVLIGDDKGNLTNWNYSTAMCNQIKLTNSPVFCMTANCDLKCVAVGVKSGGIFIYDETSHQITTKLKGHDEEIHSLQWKPSDFLNCKADLVSGSRDKTIRLWDVKNRRCISYSKLPTLNQGGRSRQDKERLWLGLHWLPTGQILSTSHSGDLLVWTVSYRQELKWTTLLPEHDSRGHNRIVFTLTPFSSHTKLITTSMDRSIVVWDVNASDISQSESVLHNHGPTETDQDSEGTWRREETIPPTDSEIQRSCTGRILLNIATLGGYTYCIRASPVDPGRLAVGVGDNLIRLWNTNTGLDNFSITSLWQGLKSKVTSLSWHPYNESQLAYGTEDGRVGVFPALAKKAPIICGTYHQKMVYVVSWGPAVMSTEAVNPKVFYVYSVGDGTILIHNLSKADTEPAKDLSLLIKEANSPTLAVRIKSEITWSHDFSQLYVGNDDGSVLVLDRMTLRCLCTIKVSNKLINAIRLQPRDSSTSSAARSQLVAIGSNENHIHIVDLSKLPSASPNTEDEGVPLINDSVLVLKHHKSRVTDMSWSSFDTNKLLSVSFDGKAIVWNLLDGSVIAEYKKQHGHLLTCVWSSVVEDLVYTGADDFSLHCWKPSKHLKHKVSQSTKHSTPDALSSKDTSATPKPNGNDNVDADDSGVAGGAASFDMTDIQRLIDEKKAELTSHQKQNDDLSKTPPCTNKLEIDLSSTTQSVTSRKQQNKYKKRAGKSYFPNMSAAAKRGKDTDIDDLIYMTRQLQANEPLTSEGHEHLGIFSVHKEDDFEKFIEKEKSTLMSDGSFEHAFHIGIWQADIEITLEQALENNALSDWLVNSACMMGHSFWLKYCRHYAKQLRAEGQIHKAVIYLLYTHDVETAIQWLKEENLYREAVCLARSRYPQGSEDTTSLYDSWYRQLKRDANYDMAAKCAVGLGEPRAALEVISRTSTVESSIRSIRFALSSPQCSDDLHILADKLTRQSLIDKQYDVISELCSPHTQLHPYLAWCLVTQSISKPLETCDFTVLQSTDIKHFILEILRNNKLDSENCVKKCSLSQQYINTRQIHVYICEKLLHLALQADVEGESFKAELIDLYVTILKQHNLQSDERILAAKTINAFLMQGRDIQEKITHCSLEATQSLSSISLFLCYIWSALTLLSYESVSPSKSDSETSQQVSQGAPQYNSFTQLVRENLQNITLCISNGVFLPWLREQLLLKFKNVLKQIDEGISAGEDIQQIHNINYQILSESCTAETDPDTQKTEVLLYILLDMLQMLYIHHSTHRESGPIPNMSPGTQLITGWLDLHLAYASSHKQVDSGKQ